MCQGIAENLVAKYLPGETVTTLEVVTDSEVDKSYSVYVVTLESEAKLVLKRSADGYEPMLYEAVLKPFSFIPAYIGRITIPDGGSWFLQEFVDGVDSRAAAPASYESAIDALAELHLRYWDAGPEIQPGITPGVDGLDSERTRAAEQFAEGAISETIRRGVLRAIDRYATRPKCVIHGDALPINVIVSRDCIKLIDWGSVEYGFYAYDLARLLAVSRNRDAELRLPEEFYKGLLERYHDRVMVSTGCTWEDLTLDFLCGRILNYAEIVLAHLHHGWEKKAWYDANFTDLERLCACIDPFPE